MADQKAAWKCSKCNAENDADFTHCRMCGEHNPADQSEKKCVSCGFLASKESCCPVCGSEQFLQL